MTSPIIQIDGNSLAAIDAASGDRMQMLVFSATWCGPCKAMAPAVEDIAASYANDVAVAKIDIEASPELAATFEVRGVPTLVIRRDGALIHRHVGGLTRTRLAMMIDDAMEQGDAAA
ncbi:thioredoxin domain-containing protein [Sphingobium sp. HBC34]|uniref:Thioredoxin domain-containing protein n=1 Tax=Sphingobium cyanobacteriorum TaxID=3063954 RepID=A0ABT8ZSW3_9SPHN|nr:thioredoxin domain-containing protein [Sphingobium sp. HBC34]MDO7837069.1 thioredoxin domain-containing protein [Sphingobium sp. HBC34]